MDIFVGRKASSDSYVYIPFDALTFAQIPLGETKILRFDLSKATFEGVLGPDDFALDTMGVPYALEPRSSGVYHLSLFMGLGGNDPSLLDVTNSYDVRIVRDDNEQNDYVTIGRGYVPDNGGFCNVTAYSYLGPGKESNVHVQIQLNRSDGNVGVILADYFLLRIAKIS